MTVRNKYRGEGEELGIGLVGCTNLLCVPQGLISNSPTLVKMYGGRPTFRFAMRCNQRDCVKRHVLRRTASRVAVERGSERESGRPTLPFVCAHAPRAAIPSLWESHDRDLGEREREGRRRPLHSSSLLQAGNRCASREYTPRMPCCGLRQSSKCGSSMELLLWQQEQ